MRQAPRRPEPSHRIAWLGAALLLAATASCACPTGPAHGSAPAADETPSAAAAVPAPPDGAATDARPPPAGEPPSGEAEEPVGASQAAPSAPTHASAAQAGPEPAAEPGPEPGAEAAPAGAPGPGAEEPSADSEEAADVRDPFGEDDPLGDDAWLEEDWLDDAGPTPAERDPWEPVNRPLHGFNEKVQDWFFDPLASAYAFVVPGAGRRAVYRFFDNLGEPVNFVNHLFQLEPVDAGATGARFVVNTTVGLVGLFDPAGRVGLAQRPTDFGQTLALYRVGSGPYLVLPVLGPSTVRDAFGSAVDALMRPDVWLFGFSPQLVTLTAGEGLAVYEAEQERIEALRESSIDFYSALRAAYLMSRDARVQARLERVCGEAGPGAVPGGEAEARTAAGGAP